MKGNRHLIDILDLSTKEIDDLISVAEDISNNKSKYSEICKGKKLATLFFEPSTRTRLSFEAAMYELGGQVLGFSSASSSSTAKGESVMDTIQVVGHYVDIIAMRHPIEGASYAASRNSLVPIINAGDGGHYHPTQTLADLLTIKRTHGRLDHLTIGICGDLKYGRTVHSLIHAMTRYEGNKFVLICPPELGLPDYIIKDELDKKGIEYKECRTLEEGIPGCDILYMTRIQGERFTDKAEYERLKDSYILDAKKMELAGDNMSVLHPLPRVKEINVDVDSDPRACYFKQVENGKLMRMALILKLLEDSKNGYEKPSQGEYEDKNLKCPNPKCVTNIEDDLPHLFRNKEGKNNVCCCHYCDTEITK